MARHYQILFKLRLHHTYYIGGASYDFHIQPTQETSRLLAKYKLLFREVDNGINILGLTTDKNTPLHELDNDLKFTLALFLKNSSFLNFSELAADKNFDEIYYLNNLSLNNNSSELTDNSWLLTTVRNMTFDYALTSEADNILVNIKNGKAESVLNKALLKQEDNFNVLIDFEEFQEGKYTLQKTEDNVDKDPEHYFLSNELKKKRPFAALEFYASELSYSEVKSYTLQFEARKAQWKYVLMLNKDYSGSTISIKDSNDVPAVAFKKEGSDYSKGQIVAFQSVEINNPSKEVKLSYNEKAVTDFDLIIEKNGLKAEVKSLPNPSIHQVKSEMYLSI